MLTTADGLNLCTLGVEEQQVGRLAAMASSIHAVSASAAVGNLDVGGGKLNAVTVMTDHAHAVVIALPHPKFDHLLLWVAAGTRDRLGGLLVHARETADRIQRVIPPI
jgi:predicted regulator of Ras-like GTPase activity (Roadblock/LC7/MglB family)